MFMWVRIVRPCVLVLCSILLPVSAFAQSVESGETIAEKMEGLVAPAFEADYAVGISAGIVRGGRTTSFGFGTTERNGGRQADGDTLYRIGSLTETFTALLLADAVSRNSIDLDELVERRLPATAQVPRFGSRGIGFRDLATHRSGLPAADPKYDRSRGEEYTVGRLYEWLAGCRLAFVPGERYEYGSMDMGIMGLALAQTAGKSWEELCGERICRPLGMKDTSTVLTEEQKNRLAQGYRPELTPVPSERFGAMEPAGGLYSSVNDLLRIMNACMGGGAPSFLEKPLAMTLERQRSTGRQLDGMDVNTGLGWLLLSAPTGDVAFQTGKARGFRSFMMFDRKTGIGVVVLGNVDGSIIEAIGNRLWLLAGEKPAPSLEPMLKNPVLLDWSVLEEYAGNYKFDNESVVRVDPYGNLLKIALPGEPDRTAIFPLSRTKFFSKDFVEAENLSSYNFLRDAQDRVTGVRFFFNGAERTAFRIK